MNGRPKLLGLPALACAWLLTSAAAAEPARFFLDYVAPPSCAGRDEWLMHLSRRSARAELASAGETAPRLHVLLTDVPAGVRVELAASDADGRGTTRLLVVPTCKEAVEASAWILALWLDPTAVGPAPVEAPIAPPSRVAAPPKTEPAPVIEPAANERTAERRAGTDSLLVGLGAEFGSFFTGLPGAPLGLGGFFEARWSRPGLVRPLLDLGALETATGTTDTARGAVHLSLLAARLRGCPLSWPEHSALQVSPCLLIELGRLAGRGSNTLDGRDANAFWRSVGASARGSVELGAYVSLSAEAGLVLPLLRDRFVFAPYPVVSGFRTPAAGATLSLAISVHLPVIGPKSGP